MRVVWPVLFLVISITGHVLPGVAADEEGDEEQRDYLNHWAVEIEGGRPHADLVAAHHGMQVERQFKSIPDFYILTKANVPHRSKRSADHHTKRLSSDLRVKFAEQQHEKKRVKRGHEEYNRDLAGSIARSTGELNDPQYMSQWYITADNSSTYSSVWDMRVKEAWKIGLSGRGVLVTIIDDGVEKNHPDLADNYEPLASHDFNDQDQDPSPRYDVTDENKHGTRCAGEVAMIANNNVCGAGIAFNSRIGGLRVLDGKVTDSLEGDAIGFGSKNIHISSASWGPNDDGKTLEKPGTIASKGIMQSITKGRDGKGTILVWAAGNGASYGDNCNCDGYTSSIYTLSISSASEKGLSPWYSEKCSSTLAATYSSGTAGEKRVVTSDLHGKCTDKHTGTSAAAPMAAGILALVMEMNPNLTWRDFQHLVVITSRYTPLKTNTGWYRNGVGLCMNHAFGFGLMDAKSLVDMANPSVWQMVGQQKICRVPSTGVQYPIGLQSGGSIEVEINTDGCQGQAQELKYLEHVQVNITLDYSKRGNIYIELESPSGTISPLMQERPHDYSKQGFQQWPLTSVHNWGENPKGTWKLRVADRQNDKASGELIDVQLLLYGTLEKPFYHDNIAKEECSHLNKYPEMPAVKRKQLR